MHASSWANIYVGHYRASLETGNFIMFIMEAVSITAHRKIKAKWIADNLLIKFFISLLVVPSLYRCRQPDVIQTHIVTCYPAHKSV